MFDWTIPDEWNIQRRVRRRRRTAGASIDFARLVAARRQLQRAGARDAAAGRAPRAAVHAAGSARPDPVPHVVLLAHVGLLPAAQRAARARARRLRGRDRLDARAGAPDVRRARARGRRRTTRCCSRPTCCHPSLANDNLSGIAVADDGGEGARAARRCGTRIASCSRPGTIGPLSWLHCNRDTLDRVVHGLTVSCIGDAGNHTYKRSRTTTRAINRAVETVLRDSGKPHRCSRTGSRGAATSASSTRPASTCRSGR